MSDIFGKGAIDKKLDLRDHQLGMAPVPFDWNGGYDIEKVLGAITDKAGFSTPTKNQNGSYSCGGQSGSYLEATLSTLNIGSFEEKSAKHIYSQIFYPQGGTTLRDVLNLIVNRGVGAESRVVSYENGNPPSEAFMRDTSQNAGAGALSKGVGYAFVSPDIDTVASAIRDNHGAIILIKGSDNGTWLSGFPVSPKLDSNGKPVWAHFLYCGKAKLINGTKYIGAHNSWGSVAGDNGWQWISEEYFKSGYITEVGVVYQDASNLVQRIALTKKLLELLQKMLTYFMGPTKKPL